MTRTDVPSKHWATLETSWFASRGLSGWWETREVSTRRRRFPTKPNGNGKEHPGENKKRIPPGSDAAAHTPADVPHATFSHVLLHVGPIVRNSTRKARNPNSTRVRPQSHRFEHGVAF